MNYYIMYLRKSRADRPDESVEEVVAKHESILQDYAKRRFGHTIPEENIYREVVSGETIADRPYMQKVLQIIEQKECLGVLVADPQRITRGDLLDCGTIVNAFRYSDTHVVTPMHDYDLSLDMDRRYFQDELLRGNDYLEYNKRILRAGREESAKRGHYLASIVPFGYERCWIDKHPTLKINEYEAYYVRKIFEMRSEGKGQRAITRWLNEQNVKPRMANCFGLSSVKNMLANDVYIGYIRWNTRNLVKVYEDGEIKKKRVAKGNMIRVKGMHEPIIDEELFNAVQEVNGKTPKVPAKYGLKNPFAGLLKCGMCGANMTYWHRSRNTSKGQNALSYYLCPKKTYGYCKNTRVDTAVVEREVIKALKNNLKDFEIHIRNGETNRPDHTIVLDQLQAERQDIEKRQINLYDLLESGVYTKEIFKERNERLDQERQQNTKAIEEVKKESENENHIVDMTRSLKQAIAAMEDDTVSIEAKNRFLKDIVEAIYVTKPHKKEYGKPEELEIRVNLK